MKRTNIKLILGIICMLGFSCGAFAFNSIFDCPHKRKVTISYICDGKYVTLKKDIYVHSKKHSSPECLIDKFGFTADTATKNIYNLQNLVHMVCLGPSDDPWQRKLTLVRPTGFDWFFSGFSDNWHIRGADYANTTESEQWRYNDTQEGACDFPKKP